MPHKIDQYVGNRLREYRTARGMSQQELADRIGISFQQLQKYERAANRIACSRLWEIGETLGAPIPYFFPEAAQSGASDPPDATLGPPSDPDKTGMSGRPAGRRVNGGPIQSPPIRAERPSERPVETQSLFDDQDALSPQNVIRLARKIAAIRNKKVRTQIMLLIDACANLETSDARSDPSKRRPHRLEQHPPPYAHRRRPRKV